MGMDTKMIKNKAFHVIQGISLLVAGGLLWYNPIITHNAAMITSSVIIGINAFIEIVS